MGFKWFPCYVFLNLMSEVLKDKMCRLHCRYNASYTTSVWNTITQIWLSNKLSASPFMTDCCHLAKQANIRADRCAVICTLLHLWRQEISVVNAQLFASPSALWINVNIDPGTSYHTHKCPQIMVVQLYEPTDLIEERKDIMQSVIKAEPFS